MTIITVFSTTEKTSHNSHKFPFTLSPTNYGFWKTMIQPFLVTNNLFGYIDGSVPCPDPTIPAAEKATTTEPQPNPSYTAWLANDAHVRMLLLSTISESSYPHAHGTTSKDLWLSLQRAYAPQSSSREYTLKTQLLKLEMKSDEVTSAYLFRAQAYADALANIGEPVKEKDLVMLVISGLREEYNGLKSTLLARQAPISFQDLHGLLADHDFMVKKTLPTVAPVQAFAATSSNCSTPTTATPPPDHLQALQQLLSQLGLPLNVASTQPSSTQAFYTNRPLPSRGRGANNRRGRGNSNPSSGGTSRSQFPWASTQNTVYGTCNRCGIGHIPSQCPNRDPNTIRPRTQPSANFAESRSQTTTWLPDTGSNNHVSHDISSIDSHTPYFGEDALHVGNGTGLPILHIGSTRFYSPSKTFSLSNILHVPEIKKNLLSVQKFCLDNDVFFEFHSSFFAVKDNTTKTTLLTGPSNNGLYSICLPSFQSLPRVAFTTIKAPSDIWHQRLGHPHPQLLNFMCSKYCLPVSSKLSDSFCNSYHIGKSSKLHLSSSSFNSKNLLDLVVCDVWGPAPVTSSDGHNYFLLFNPTVQLPWHRSPSFLPSYKRTKRLGRETPPPCG
ncbi:hypothetical protein L2E82_15974 [Cichorium intybus]|uniref:Uncharacterized protein n=1 Tax=Cichorium intybus TaxID=13427 RepID=A0ACB9F5I4_CICIN|nr:hypothetical protein L2E82_15974 [Cichorium intybus]